MAENPTNIKDKNERRDVRRNTSNQIVSYTLPTNSVEQYGLVKLPAIKEELNKEQFERVINTNVTEFQFNIPDTNLELISLNDIFFPQKVITDAPSLLDALREKYNSRYTPDFNSNNGLYEIPPGYTRDYYPIKLPFDKVITGQSQDVESGTFLITQELKDSGYDLLLRYKVTAEYRGTGGGSSFRTMFDFDNADGIQSPKIVTNSPALKKGVSIGYVTQTLPTPFQTLNPNGSGNFIKTFRRRANQATYRVTNSEMRVSDKWQVKALIGSSNTQLIADASYFEIEVVEPDTQASGGSTGNGTIFQVDNELPTTGAQGPGTITDGTLGGGVSVNKIICNELYRQGYLEEKLWDADERYGDIMFEKNPKLVIGYQMWARRVVKYMRKHPNNTKIAYWLFKPWTKYMGYKMGVVEKPTLRGRFTNWIGSQFSYMVFNLCNGKRLLNKYNYKLFKSDITEDLVNIKITQRVGTDSNPSFNQSTGLYN